MTQTKEATTVAPRDILEGNVGLPDNFRFKVESAEYNYDTSYNSGQTLLLILRGPRTLEDGEVQPDQHEFLSCGNNWVMQDGGNIAVHETLGDPATSEKARFNNQTKAFKFFKRLAEIGLGDKLRAGKGDGRGPYNAQMFVGMEFLMKQEPYTLQDGTEKTTAMPVQVLNDGSGNATPPPNSTAATPTAAAEAVAANTTAAPATNGQGNGDVRARLLAAAVEVKNGGGDNNAFVTKVTTGNDKIDGWEQFASDVVEGTIFAQA